MLIYKWKEHIGINLYYKNSQYKDYIHAWSTVTYALQNRQVGYLPPAFAKQYKELENRIVQVEWDNEWKAKRIRYDRVAPDSVDTIKQKAALIGCPLSMTYIMRPAR